MTTIKRTKKERIAELLASNNALLERARKAEAQIGRMELALKDAQQAVFNANAALKQVQLASAKRLARDLSGSEWDDSPSQKATAIVWEKKPDDPEWWWNGYMIGQWGNMKRTEHFNCFRPNSMVAFAQATTLAAAQRLCEDDAQTNAK